MPVIRSFPQAVTLLGLLASCGPDVPATEDWMLGVFSSQALGMTERNLIEQHVLSEDGVAEYRHLNSGGVIEGFPKHRTWKPLSEDELIVYANPDDDETIVDDYHWIVTRNGACGPHSTEMFEDDEPDGGGVPWYPGEHCIELLMCGDAPCGYWEVVVCDGGQAAPSECYGAEND